MALIMTAKLISIIKILLRFTSRLLLREKSAEDFKKSCKADKILIISLTHLGDIVLLSPFLYNLRRNFPHTQIDILLKEQVNEIIEDCPYINNRIIYNAKWVIAKNRKGDGLVKTLKLIRRLRKSRYGSSFVTHPHIFSNIIPWLARVPFRAGYNDEVDGFLNIHMEKGKCIQHAHNYHLDLLRYLGLEVESKAIEIFLSAKDMTFADEFYRNLSLPAISFFVGIHPGAGIRDKIWLPERFAEVIQYLINRYNAYILLFAGKQEVDITEKIKINLTGYEHRISDFTGKTTLQQMASLMMLCKVILANDSGPMHIASALNKPTVALFAGMPEYRLKWVPVSEGSLVVSKGSRLEDIKVEDVIEALDKILLINN